MRLYGVKKSVRLRAGLVVLVSAKALKRCPAPGREILEESDAGYMIRILSPAAHTLVHPGLALKPGESFGFPEQPPDEEGNVLDLVGSERDCLELLEGKELEKEPSEGRLDFSSYALGAKLSKDPEPEAPEPIEAPEAPEEEGVAKLEPAEVEEVSRADLIRAAVAELDPDDAAHYTRFGNPRLPLVEEKTGLEGLTLTEIQEAVSENG